MPVYQLLVVHPDGALRTHEVEAGDQGDAVSTVLRGRAPGELESYSWPVHTVWCERTGMYNPAATRAARSLAERGLRHGLIPHADPVPVFGTLIVAWQVGDKKADADFERAWAKCFTEAARAVLVGLLSEARGHIAKVGSPYDRSRYEDYAAKLHASVLTLGLEDLRGEVDRDGIGIMQGLAMQICGLEDAVLARLSDEKTDEHASVLANLRAGAVMLNMLNPA